MEKFKEIERGIITTYRKRLWSKFTRAVKEYKLVNKGDCVCVCISGGKDSMLLAKLFQELKAHSEVEFDVRFLVMNPGYNKKNLSQIKKNLKILNIPAEIVETNIFNVANNMQKNACYICAKMRRGALYRLAQERGCNKIALGHHYDDVIETTLMNMLNAGSFQTMLPKLKSDNYEGMELIRPMYLIRERDIKVWAESNGLQFIQCACRFTEKASTQNSSQRQNTKQLIQNLKQYNEFVEANIFSAATNVNLNKIVGWQKDGKQHTFLENFKRKK